MELEPADAADALTHAGRELVFCSTDCGNTFRASPASFLGPQDRPVPDAVCGMTLHPTPTAPRAEFRGRVYVFCSTQCHWRFTTSPRFFVDPPEVA